MATVKIDKFGGIVPRVAPSLLPDGMATVAHNCSLESGKLVPLREPSAVDAGAHTVYHENGLVDVKDANSAYCWKHTLSDGMVRTDFLLFPGLVYFTHGNIADDEHDRIFVTGETGLVYTDSAGVRHENAPCAYLFDRVRNRIVRHTIVKEPMTHLRCSVKSMPEGVAVDSDAYFFVSWFDEYGYESPASMSSQNLNESTEPQTDTYRDVPLRYAQGSTVEFLPVFVPPQAAGVRLYKSWNSSETYQIQFLREYSSAEFENLKSKFYAIVDDQRLGETMPEIESPPYDLVDMIFVPGNYYAGRARSMPHTVLFSDVDNPTNWPTAYRYDVRDNVVKLAVTSNSVFALTDGTPFVLSGTAPESMTVASLATPAACVSERSVVVHRNVVYFASNDGLMAIADGAGAGSSCTNVTEAYMTPDQWRALNPKSCIVGVHRDALYMFFHKADGTAVNMRFDLRDGATALTTHDEEARCAVVDYRDGKMYFVREV